ncbi:MAG: hypothetical protein LBH18_04010 [Spirochaetaceae bacterium]|jgi:hypothetical protein|nr:hypothetical protein [Spirochaetaceae bacterium]
MGSGNYCLANDITLDSSTLGQNWEGPEGYRGHFNGNGKTIKLELANTKGDIALFNSLADTAIIENFNIEVTTKGSNGTDHLAMTGTAHFGGVVADISGIGNYILRNISITGNLNYKLSGGQLLAGGLIGQVGGIMIIKIENCSSDININVVEDDLNSGDYDGVRGFGGLIGKITGSSGNEITINHCRTGGEIVADLSSNTTDPKALVAGGIVGDIIGTGNGDNNAKSNVIIKNCYSTMDINLKTAMNGLVAGGGLVGRYGTSYNSARISNSVALNKTINAQSSHVSSNTSAHRVVGVHSGNGQVANNYALSTMMVNESAVSDTAANSLDGLSKTANDLKAEATWVSGLSFSKDNWDFSNIARDGYPTLKLKSSN